MLLLHPVRAALAIESQCRSPDGSTEQAFLEALRLLTPRVESALNVGSLTQGVFSDTFAAPAKPGLLKLYLTNAFLSPGSVVFEDMTVDGEPVTADLVDDRHGIVYVRAIPTDSGYFTVTYGSGFAIPEDEGTDDEVHEDIEYRTLVGVPDGIASIVSATLIYWRRNMVLQPSVSKEYGFLPSLNAAVERELTSRIYSWYQRPRHNAVFPLSHLRRG